MNELERERERKLVGKEEGDGDKHTQLTFIFTIYSVLFRAGAECLQMNTTHTFFYLPFAHTCPT